MERTRDEGMKGIRQASRQREREEERKSIERKRWRQTNGWDPRGWMNGSETKETQAAVEERKEEKNKEKSQGMIRWSNTHKEWKRGGKGKMVKLT